MEAPRRKPGDVGRKPDREPGDDAFPYKPPGASRGIVWGVSGWGPQYPPACAWGLLCIRFPIQAPRRKPGDSAGCFGMNAASSPCLRMGAFIGRGLSWEAPDGSRGTCLRESVRIVRIVLRRRGRLNRAGVGSRFPILAAETGSRPDDRSVGMITHQKGLLGPPSRPASSSSPEAERERLRRELLQRILDREMRRQAVRGVPR